MTYIEGSWGERAKLRSQSRNEYFKNYRRLHPQKYIGYGSSLGYKGELIGLKVLKGSKKINRPCDLSWRGKLVDVKTAKPTSQKGGGNRWKFLLVKQKNKVDLFLLIRKDIYDKVIDIHLIPGEKIRGTNISFNERTVIKYSKYLLSL
jgi:hypothetical protein